MLNNEPCNLKSTATMQDRLTETEELAQEVNEMILRLHHCICGPQLFDTGAPQTVTSNESAIDKIDSIHRKLTNARNVACELQQQVY